MAHHRSRMLSAAPASGPPGERLADLYVFGGAMALAYDSRRASVGGRDGVHAQWAVDKDLMVR